MSPRDIIFQAESNPFTKLFEFQSSYTYLKRTINFLPQKVSNKIFLGLIELKNEDTINCFYIGPDHYQGKQKRIRAWNILNEYTISNFENFGDLNFQKTSRCKFLCGSEILIICS